MITTRALIGLCNFTLLFSAGQLDKSRICKFWKVLISYTVSLWKTSHLWLAIILACTSRLRQLLTEVLRGK